MKHIGIVCEGPTDYVILKRIIDTITNGCNEYKQLQPEADLMGRYGNGWKGVLKWCNDNANIRRQLMKGVSPALDFLVIQMDGDVSRKDKPSHCGCNSVECPQKGIQDPLQCNTTICPVVLPCADHIAPVFGYMEHLKGLILSKLKEAEDTCIVIPCDSTEAWIVAAYDGFEDVELLEAPWENVIAKGKAYHNIRISGKK